MKNFSQQQIFSYNNNYLVINKKLVTTKFCYCNKKMVIATNIWSWPKKIFVVVTKN